MNWKETLTPSLYPTGFGQGYFRYFRSDGGYDDILAISGTLHKNGEVLAIEGLPNFQGNKQIEAVQFKDKMYIATGTKLVMYDGTTAKVIVPYTPQPLEALYIGTNALADNPDQFITDGESAFLRIDGVTLDKRYGVANSPTTFKAYVSKPTGIVEYKWEWRKLNTDTWNDWKDHSAFTADLKEVSWVTSTGDYEIRVLARMQGDTFQEEYYIPKYTVNETDENKKEDTSNIHACNRIVLHWNRIIMYGDAKQPDMIYISDLDRPDYFPTLNTLRFENERREPLTALVEFRDMLVAFTPTSIQALFGKSPQDYSRLMLSNAIGCIAPFSAQVMENYLAFLSQEGVHILKTLGYTENRANVQKIDTKIDNIIPRDTNACALVVDGQYQLTFPDTQKRFRYYYQQQVWSKDESPSLDFVRSYEWEGVTYNQKTDGSVLVIADSYTDDGYVYTDHYVTKEYDFGMPYNPKKLKELQMLLHHFGGEQKLAVSVFVDGMNILGQNKSYASINDAGEVVWNIQGNDNVVLDAGTSFGYWKLGESAFGGEHNKIIKLPLSGKGHRVRVEVTHTEPTPTHLLGLGVIHKVKKP